MAVGWSLKSVCVNCFGLLGCKEHCCFWEPLAGLLGLVTLQSPLKFQTTQCAQMIKSV